MTKFRFSADALEEWASGTGDYDKNLERALLLCVLWDAPELVRKVIATYRRSTKIRPSIAAKMLSDRSRPHFPELAAALVVNCQGDEPFIDPCAPATSARRASHVTRNTERPLGAR